VFDIIWLYKLLKTLDLKAFYTPILLISGHYIKACVVGYGVETYSLQPLAVSK